VIGGGLAGPEAAANRRAPGLPGGSLREARPGGRHAGALTPAHQTTDFGELGLLQFAQERVAQHRPWLV